MSRVFRKLKELLISLPKAHHNMWYWLNEKPKLYPPKFKNEQARRAHASKLNLLLTISMYE